MQVLTIINQPGPLPITLSFNAPLVGPALLAVTGSLWASALNTMLQLNVSLDGAAIGSVQLFSNGPSTHRALPTLFLGINLTSGPHTLAFTASGPSVVSDLNDFFFAGLLY
jgi:hypothetical protein